MPRGRPTNNIRYLRGEPSTLSLTPQLDRLVAHLRDLTTIAYEASTNRRSKSLSLIRLDYVSGEKEGGKYYMRFNALVREADLPDAVPLVLTIGVEKGDEECFPL